MDVVIGIDTGTTATKGVAAGLDGELRALTSVHYPLSVPGPGPRRARPGHGCATPRSRRWSTSPSSAGSAATG